MLVRLTKGTYSRILLIEPTIRCLLRICFMSCDILSNRFFVYFLHLLRNSATVLCCGWHYDIKRIAPVFKPVVSWSCARQGRGCAGKANSEESNYVSLEGGDLDEDEEDRIDDEDEEDRIDNAIGEEDSIREASRVGLFTSCATKLLLIKGKKHWLLLLIWLNSEWCDWCCRILAIGNIRYFIIDAL